MYYQLVKRDPEKRFVGAISGCYEQLMVEGGGGTTGGNGGDAPVSPADIAAYIHEIAGALAIAAREAGLEDIADTLTSAQRQSAAVLGRAGRTEPSN